MIRTTMIRNYNDDDNYYLTNATYLFIIFRKIILYLYYNLDFNLRWNAFFYANDDSCNITYPLNQNT